MDKLLILFLTFLCRFLRFRHRSFDLDTGMDLCHVSRPAGCTPAHGQAAGGAETPVLLGSRLG
jgi:hypothetical protein